MAVKWQRSHATALRSSCRLVRASALVRAMQSLDPMTHQLAYEAIDVTSPSDQALACCEFCRGDYSLDLEIICGDCQQTLCPFCATRRGSTYCCPKCQTARNPVGVAQPGVAQP
jgi:hypothetical protein